MIKDNKIVCPECVRQIADSSGEKSVYDWVCTILNTEEILMHQTIGKFNYDLYLPAKALAIEYHGLYYHSLKMLENKKVINPEQYHLEKYKTACANGIFLYQFWADEWKYKLDIIKSLILAKIHPTSFRTVLANKCDPIDLEQSEAKKFLEANHLRGSCSFMRAKGFLCGDELVAVMALDEHPEYLEMKTFCIKLYTTLAGVPTYFKHFRKCLITYSDNRYSDDAWYTNLGFDFSEEIKPTFEFAKNLNRISKQSAYNKFKTTDNSEIEKHGYYRLFDAGKKRWILRDTRPSELLYIT